MRLHFFSWRAKACFCFFTRSRRLTQDKTFFLLVLCRSYKRWACACFGLSLIHI